MNIRFAEESDLEALMVFCRRCFPFRVPEDEARDSFMNQLRYGTVILAIDEGVRGVLAGETRWSQPFQQKMATERVFLVDPEYRNRGAGKALVGMFEAWARAHGAKEVVLGTSQYGGPDPLAEAKKLETMGYSLLGYFVRKEL